ncbi:Hypothetical protein R9X50_00088500 [Acrodontium crateriforme]|uniref:U6 small nuclear RNA (adenine-(43)-N(6))-methyltransferase n=1 Tax=Acrodontium crateriforme TaxID=150365 RepID=A0AAQ3LZN8_9PEZI|nr:Hypothetical protein R9X50_00088500 [Acrodontium crateriforme]
MSQQEAKTRTRRESYYHNGDVDFDELAAHDQAFAAICKGAKTRRWIDFKDPKVVQQLTRSLLKHDFNLSLTLPPDRLCPPVPVRWNYVRWIQDLLDTSTPFILDPRDARNGRKSRTNVVGLDIGVGASCIYALLACAAHPDWHMRGTDIDAHSLEYARANVKANGLEDRITLSQSESAEASLISVDENQPCTFVMTNPPFYSSEAEMRASYTDKTAPASAICTGSTNEMLCPGGDLGFVLRILDESLVLRSQIQWYTAMFGHLSSLHLFVDKLREHKIDNYAVTSLHAGLRTKRWAIAWSFGPWRPKGEVARHGDVSGGLAPPTTAWSVEVPLMDAVWSWAKVDDVVNGLDVKWVHEGGMSGIMEAPGNTWSRAARRRKKFGNAEENQRGDDHTGESASKRRRLTDEQVAVNETNEAGLMVRISCKHEAVHIDWLRGNDTVLFESFCGVIRRSLIHLLPPLKKKENKASNDQAQQAG